MKLVYGNEDDDLVWAVLMPTSVRCNDQHAGLLVKGRIPNSRIRSISASVPWGKFTTYLIGNFILFCNWVGGRNVRLCYRYSLILRQSILVASFNRPI